MPRLHCQQRKEPTRPISPTSPPGGTHRYREGLPLPSSGPLHDDQGGDTVCAAVSVSLPPVSGTNSGSNGGHHRRSRMGQAPLQATSVVPASPPAFHRPAEAEAIPHCQVVPPLVAGPSTPPLGEGVPGLPQSHSNNGCQQQGLGHPLPHPDSPGPLDGHGEETQYQLAGTPGHPPGTPHLPLNNLQEACVGKNRQHHRKGPHKSTGGHPLILPSPGSAPSTLLGGLGAGIPDSSSCEGRSQHSGRLAQQGRRATREVVSSSGHVSTNHGQDGDPSNRPLRISPECPVAPIHDPFSVSVGNSDGRPINGLAEGFAVRLSTDPSNLQSPEEDTTPAGPNHPDSSILASAPLVSRATTPLQGTAVGTANASRSALTRPSTSPQSRVVKACRLETERRALRQFGYSNRVVATMLASCRPSTNRIYQSTWRAFLRWSSRHSIPRGNANLRHLLLFLQEGLEKGLRPNTLKRQAASLVGLISGGKSDSWKTYPHLKRFLRGATLLSPPTVHRFPSWDLHVVLKALQKPPFEPVASIPLRILSFKLAFLVAVTSARHISELRALSIHKSFCIFSKEAVRLIPDPFVRPKVASVFHQSQDVFLPSFCPHPKHERERLWHNLDVCRCLKKYITHTSTFRTSDKMFVSFHPRSMGSAVSAPTIAHWIRACIKLAYEVQRLSPPSGVSAHSTRAVATSAAFSTNAPVQDICRAATWSTPSTFTRHYKIETHADLQAAFGRRVLQRVLPQE
ncbi:uncharacterized protein LOC128345502 [Hemicordylus capensis]|uniref:uncharacterized protein LOC128345502 n=1 Tax=Hemicordylus capensis TaxID=884348 RepID=UPI0023021495|nr:uncharacterized protein LOC128345502 [Hemicordylus capensis]